MLRIYSSISLTLLLVSCAAQNHEKTFRGTYSYGHEVQHFTPCNSDDVYWASFDWAGIEMHEHYKKTPKEPYQSMYIEFRGQVLNEIVDGFAEQTSGLVRISEVNYFTFEVPASCM